MIKLNARRRTVLAGIGLALAMGSMPALAQDKPTIKLASSAR